jgi:exosortase/archaeosortase family protein
MSQSNTVDSQSTDGGESGQSEKRPIIKAVLIFAVVMGLFYTIDYTPFLKSEVLQRYLEWIASSCSWLLNLVGVENELKPFTLGDKRLSYTIIDYVGQRMSVPDGRFTVQIVRGCDALDPSAAFVAAVLASPMAVWLKLPGIFVGVVSLLVINLMRICSLFLVGVYKPSYFDMMHGDVWQAAFIVLAIVFWAIWVHWATKISARSEHATA